MQLLERDGELSLLAAGLDEAAGGKGCVAIVRGEAGIGKTSLVRGFVADHRAHARVLWGGCDDLLTPAPLSPIWDMVEEAPSLADAVRRGEPIALFSEVLRIMGSGLRPTLMVIEDIHWADGATLDMIRYVGRRIAGTHGMLIVTYRMFGVGEDPAATQAVTDIPADASIRLDLFPLTQDAVADLAAGTGHSLKEIYAQSGGNPFLVTEMLTVGGGSIPATVRDSVLARARKLSTGALEIVEFVAVVPSRTDRRLLEGVMGPVISDLVETELHGLLVVSEHDVSFRHEIARRAMESTLSGTHRQTLNRIVFEALAVYDADPARLVHHARAAGDTDGIVRYAPVAARRAASLASHEEAVANYRLLEGLLDSVETEERASILEAWAWEEWTVGVAEAAERRALEAARLWEEVGDQRGVSRTMRILTQARWGLGDIDGAAEAAALAVESLEPHVPTPELAAAYAIQSWLSMIRVDPEPAVRAADKAIELSEIVGDVATRAHVLNNKGVVLAYEKYPEGLELLEESFSVSLANGLDQEAIRAAANLGDVHREHRNLAAYERWLEEAERLTEESGSSRFGLHLKGRRADLHLLRGDWDMAEHSAQAALTSTLFVAPDRATPLTVLGLLAVRSGRGDGLGDLKEAERIGWELDNLERLAPAVAGIAEALYLKGELGAIPASLTSTMDLAVARRFPWTIGELAYWLWKAGSLVDPPNRCAEPYRHQIEGEWRWAADLWEARGMPYQQALALSEGDVQAQILAIRILDDLGASALSAQVRTRLREQGVTGLPRKSRRGGRANVAGLTPRQVEVLELMAEGYTNSEIAERIFISTKTVEHHVTAILAGLNVKNRKAAIEGGRALRLIE